MPVKTKKLGIMERMAQNIGMLQRAYRPASTAGMEREPMSERAFVRAFGSKVVHYRLSNRPDFVGLMVCGRNTGFIITKDSSGLRKIRLLDIVDDKANIRGRMQLTKRYLRVKTHESVSLLQRGLLKYVS